MLWETETESCNQQTKDYTEEAKEIEQQLLPYDILASLAHAKMLADQGYLTETELGEIEQVLAEIYKERPEVKGEDVHTFLEKKLTEATAAGKKIHAGRSRNDQVVTATRLLIKDSAIEIALASLDLIKSLEGFAEEKNKLMPGYTHQRQAMPSSTGLWASSYLDSLIDDLKFLKSVFQLVDTNPLGAAAGYGTELAIDRDKTTELLGFNGKQENPIYCVHRGKHELFLLQALNQIMLDLQKLAEDLINFSSQPKFFQLPSEFTTGSSIMPQKENPDVLEIARAKAEEVAGYCQMTRSAISKLPHGYNRDTQQTKEYLMKAIEVTGPTLSILSSLVDKLEVNDGYKLKDEIFAAYTANKLVKNGLPFRKAYQQVKEREQPLSINRESVKPPQHQPYQSLEQFWQEQRRKWEGKKNELLATKQIKE